MENVDKKLANLRKALKDDLYYDREELMKKAVAYMGREEGRTQEKIEIARNLINLGLNDNDIMIATGLSQEEIKSLKEDN